MPAPWLASLLVFVGGGAGANARYWLDVLVRKSLGEGGLPWATLFINVSGSAALGVVSAVYLGRPDDARGRAWALLLGTGFCGGYTTFSTFSREASQLLRDGRPAAAAAYAGGSVAAGVVGFWLAARAAR